MTQEELNEVLENHKHWLNEDCKDWKYMGVDLSGVDLSGLDLRGADLERAKIC